MRDNDEYQNALNTAHAAMADLEKRGSGALGSSWEEVEQSLFTPQEIAQSNLRIALIGEICKARQEQGLSQKKLEELSGVKQPVIARMERGTTVPNLDTVLKLLAPLGKTLYIGDLKT